VDLSKCCGLIDVSYLQQVQLSSCRLSVCCKTCTTSPQQVEVMEFEHMSCVELALGGLNFISRGGWLKFSLGGLQSQTGDMLYVTLIFCICLAERVDGSLPTGR